MPLCLQNQRVLPCKLALYLENMSISSRFSASSWHTIKSPSLSFCSSLPRSDCSVIFLKYPPFVKKNSDVIIVNERFFWNRLNLRCQSALFDAAYCIYFYFGELFLLFHLSALYRRLLCVLKARNLCFRAFNLADAIYDIFLLRLRSFISAIYSACFSSIPKPSMRFGTTIFSSSVSRNYANRTVDIKERDFAKTTQKVKLSSIRVKSYVSSTVAVGAEAYPLKKYVSNAKRLRHAVNQ